MVGQFDSVAFYSWLATMAWRAQCALLLALLIAPKIMALIHAMRYGRNAPAGSVVTWCRRADTNAPLIVLFGVPSVFVLNYLAGGPGGHRPVDFVFQTVFCVLSIGALLGIASMNRQASGSPSAERRDVVRHDTTDLWEDSRNPSTGLPMVGGGGVDVSGTPYGLNGDHD